MIRLRMGYPLRSEERRLLRTHRSGEPVESLRPVLDGEDIRRLQLAVRQVRVDDSIAEYLLDIVHATRETDELNVGVSTRGGLTFYRAAQGLALVSGRDYVVPDDIKALAVPVALAPRRRQVVLAGRRVRRRRGDHPRHRGPAPRARVKPGRKGSEMPDRRSWLRRFGRWLAWNLWPNQRLRGTREGVAYFGFLARAADGRPPAANQT